MSVAHRKTPDAVAGAASGLPLKRKLAQRLAHGQLEIPIAASYSLADAAQALAQAAVSVGRYQIITLSEWDRSLTK